MRSLLFILLAFVSIDFAIAQKASAPDPRLAGIDVKLQALLSEWKVAGFAVAVVEKNKVVYAKGFGYRDLENKKPVTPNTLFAIGSCTKAFTSALLGQLRNEKKLSFSDQPGNNKQDRKKSNEIGEQGKFNKIRRM